MLNDARRVGMGRLQRYTDPSHKDGRSSHAGPLHKMKEEVNSMET